VTIWFLTLLLTTGATLHAGQGDFTLHKAISLGEQRAEEIRLALEEVEVAEAGRDRSASALMPEVRGQSTILSHQILAQWSLLNNRVWANRKLAAQTEKAASLKLEITKQQLRQLIITAYFKAFSIRLNLENYARKLPQYRKNHELITQLNKEHMAEKTVFMLSQTNLRNLESEYRSRQFEFKQSLLDLRFLTGETLIESAFPGEPSIDSVFSRVGNLVPREAQSVRVAYSRSLVDQVRIGKELQMSSHYPDLLGVASYGFGNGVPANSVFNGFADGGRIGLFITIPLFSGLSSFAERDEWNHKIAMSEIQTERSKRDFIREMEQRLQNIRFVESEARQIGPMLEETRRYWHDSHSAQISGAITLQTWYQTGAALQSLETRYVDLLSRGMMEIATIKVLLGQESDL